MSAVSEFLAALRALPADAGDAELAELYALKFGAFSEMAIEAERAGDRVQADNARATAQEAHASWKELLHPPMTLDSGPRPRPLFDACEQRRHLTCPYVLEGHYLRATCGCECHVGER